MVDFEKTLIKSFESNFENTTIDVCYFHFVKHLWASTKRLNLYNKINLKIQKY